MLIDVRSCQAEERTEEEAVIKTGLDLSEINGGLILRIDQEPYVCVFGIFANYRTFALLYLLVYFQSAGKEASTYRPTLDSGRTVWFSPWQWKRLISLSRFVASWEEPGCFSW